MGPGKCRSQFNTPQFNDRLSECSGRGTLTGENGVVGDKAADLPNGTARSSLINSSSEILL